MNKSLFFTLSFMLFMLVAASYALRIYHYKAKAIASMIQIPEKDINPDGSMKLTLPDGTQPSADYAKLFSTISGAFNQKQQSPKQKPKPQKKGVVIIFQGKCVMRNAQGERVKCPE